MCWSPYGIVLQSELSKKKKNCVSKSTARVTSRPLTRRGEERNGKDSLIPISDGGPT
jgi:hypothetical protein